ncbi:alkane 1-monooxygenase [Aliiglaciecola sp. CAU 1673]|uniref:alkane 1-monooxygenase n=1 Tax=Aliiglaciecola sp. CAU 1673 TaxID=3032595 RepID=UPI0023DB846F|nr:alkane 1-monooxygenase [Aliiglaciecola sp. CAU 1673]MDF2180123.1 alkane 1-monooxygenase [Aliiglaciecola sp. CAU 1673]
MKSASPFPFALAFLVAYLPAVVFALCLWMAGNVGNSLWLALLPALFLYFVMPPLDYLLGRDTLNPSSASQAALKNSKLLKALPVMTLPLQATLLFGSAAWLSSLPDISWVHWVVWAISLGVVGGVTAINPAHELIHRNSRLERGAGGALLSLVAYPSFKIEHIRGHHVNVATPLDNSTAKRGQSVYAFVPVAIFKNLRSAWQFERKRLAHQRLPVWHWRNELLGWWLLTAAIALLMLVCFGVYGLAFFLLQSLVAIVELEAINYIEHYGLLRKQLANGRYEPPNENHSWDSSFLLSNLMLFQLQRHADHHAHPGRPYPLLRHCPGSPQLPGGYASMLLLALFPPLWRRVIHPRLQRYCAKTLTT